MNVQTNAVDETAILIEKDVDVPMRLIRSHRQLGGHASS